MASSLCLQKMMGYSCVALYLKKGFKSTLVIDGEVERQIAREGKSCLFFPFLGHNGRQDSKYTPIHLMTSFPDT